MNAVKKNQDKVLNTLPQMLEQRSRTTSLEEEPARAKTGSWSIILLSSTVGAIVALMRVSHDGGH
jgi:hypothetical protein